MSLRTFLEKNIPESVTNTAHVHTETKIKRQACPIPCATPELLNEFATVKDKNSEDSKLVKFVKDSKIDISDEFKIKGDWIISKGSIGIASPFNIDFSTRCAFVKKRDEKTKHELKDNCFFKWYFDDWELLVEKKLKGELYKLSVSQIQDLHLNLNMSEDDCCSKYILPISQISVKYPHSRNPTTFTIMADDELHGFTAKELKEKIYSYYHMLLYMGKYYDARVKKCLTPDELKLCKDVRKWDNELPFEMQLIKTNHMGCGNEGISGLVYNKIRDEWHVEKANYC